MYDSSGDGLSDRLEATASEADIHNEALQVFRAFVRPYRLLKCTVVIVGYCLGGSTASFITIHEPDTQLILVGCFPNIATFAQSYVSWLPEAWVKVGYDIESHLKQSQANVYLMHSAKDEVMKCEYSTRVLYNAAKSRENKSLNTVMTVLADGKHNAVPYTEEFHTSLKQILNTF
jgi:hypothetical protein